MNIRDIALSNIKSRKSNADMVADNNLKTLLLDEDIKTPYILCKSLMIDIAKAEFRGEDSTKLKEKYADTKKKIAKIFKKKKIDKSVIKPQYECTKCGDKGILLGQDCECLTKEISRLLFRECGLNLDTLPDFDTTKFDIYSDKATRDKVTQLYTLVNNYIEKIKATTKKFIVISGQVGVGKTHLLQCAVKKGIDSGILSYYTTAFGLNQDMLKCHCASLNEKESILSKYIDADLLCIDDLGTESIYKNVTVEYLYLILNERQQRNKNTIITTNLTPDKIQDTYDDRIFSRLVSKKDSILVEIVSDDLRLKKAN